jgi:D-threo-aldose 1-dehydrogenase
MRDQIHLSPLGFGCASIMGKIGQSNAIRAMSLAFDLGISHFDVARSYGFGRAEMVVGSFIKDKRDAVTITSKFGVVPPTLNIRTRTLIPIARAVSNLLPHLKASLKKRSGQMLASRNFEVTYARQCLDQSLSALGTDYLDIYLIHEPEKLALNNPDELVSFLNECVIRGKIRRWGMALHALEDYQWTSAIGGDVIQFEGNIESSAGFNEISSDSRQRIVTRPFMGGLEGKFALANTVQNLNLTPLLHDLKASVADVSLCLAMQLAADSGSVVCSMFSPNHIRKNVRAIYELSKDERMIEAIVKINNSMLNHSHNLKPTK